MQFVGVWVSPFFQITGEKILVFFDNLIDQRAMRQGDRFEIAFALVVSEKFDNVLAVMRWKIQQHAFAAEAFANLGNQFG